LPILIRIKGALDPVALRVAWERFIARHEAFRTTFSTSASGQPVQQVHPAHAVEMPVEDLQSLPLAEQANEAYRFARDAVREPFDLEHAPPFRITLLRLAPDEYQLVGAAHHLIGDGTSQAILLSELAAEYAAARTGKAAAIVEPELQYIDYAVWQRTMAETGYFDRMLDFWVSQLTPPYPGLHLPMKTTTRQTTDYSGDIVRFAVAADVVEQVDTLAFDLGTSRFVILISVLYLLLHAATKQQDLLVSVAVANRSRPEVFNNIVGCLAKQVPFRLRWSDDVSFETLVGLVHEQSRQVLKNQAAPVIKAVERLGLNHAPQAAIGRVVFIYQNAVLQRVDAHDVTMEMQARWELLGIAREEMVWQLFDAPEGIDGWLEYQTARFESALMNQLTADYTRLLAAAVTEPSRKLSSFALQSVK
jgi:hypothetical protein